MPLLILLMWCLEQGCLEIHYTHRYCGIRVRHFLRLQAINLLAAWFWVRRCLRLYVLWPQILNWPPLR
jgi:hypothetical protein